MNPWRAGDFPTDCDHCGVVLTVNDILLECLQFVRQRRPIREYFISQRRRFTKYGLLEDIEETTSLLVKYLRDTELLIKL